MTNDDADSLPSRDGGERLYRGRTAEGSYHERLRPFP